VFLLVLLAAIKAVAVEVKMNQKLQAPPQRQIKRMKLINLLL
jgi:hypothetical protein